MLIRCFASGTVKCVILGLQRAQKRRCLRMNESVYLDDTQIDRRNLTVILTCPLEDEQKLMKECSSCSYAWVENFGL